MSALNKLIADLADALEAHEPGHALISFARGVIAGMAITPASSKPRGGWRKQATDEDRAIRAAYEGGQSIISVAAQFKRSPAIITAAVKRAGGKMRPKGAARGEAKSDPRSDLFWAEYCGGATLEQIGRANGMTRERVRQIIAKGGYVIKEAPRPLPELHQAGINAYLAGDSLNIAANAAGVSPLTMRGILTRNGHEIRPNKRTKKYNALKVERAAELYREGRPIPEMAGEIGVAHATSVYRLLGYAGVRPSRQRKQPVT